MLNTLAIANYRSLLKLTLKLGQLNVITGANGSGKSNLYRALRLLAETAQGGVINALAKEGGLDSTFWAGPETFSKCMKDGTAPVQGLIRNTPMRLRLGFTTNDFSYAITLGLPAPDGTSMFTHDPEIKHEAIWHGTLYRPASTLVVRDNAVIKIRDGSSWEVSQTIQSFDSLFSQTADPERAPEALRLRESIRQWRFYDHFRTDADAPARQPQLGTRTPVLHHDGRDLAAALRTIDEIGDREALEEAISDAFPGSHLNIVQQDGGRFVIEFHHHGLLRPLNGAELSDGMLRYLLLVAALLTPRPPPLMVLNEPENSLHPDLLPALARLIIQATQHTQVWVVSHAQPLVAALKQSEHCNAIELEKILGETKVIGQTGLLSTPSWHWPDGG
ncbi:MAG: AAA family ATPase [Methylotenera sp.]|nr:AAA family ATPase [Methylotenera sp.]